MHRIVEFETIISAKIIASLAQRTDMEKMSDACRLSIRLVRISIDYIRIKVYKRRPCTALRYVWIIGRIIAQCAAKIAATVSRAARLTPRGVHSTPYPDILQFLDSRSQSIVFWMMCFFIDDYVSSLNAKIISKSLRRVAMRFLALENTNRVPIASLFLLLLSRTSKLQSFALRHAYFGLGSIDRSRNPDDYCATWVPRRSWSLPWKFKSRRLRRLGIIRMIRTRENKSISLWKCRRRTRRLKRLHLTSMPLS